jgi:DNA modification methylase
MRPYYQDDLVTIYHGDCLELLPSVTADLTLTDPPYNVGLDYSDGDRRADYADWTDRWAHAVPRPLVVTPGHANLGMWLAMEKPRWVCAWVKPNQNSASALNGWNVWEPLLVYGKHHKPVGHDVWTLPIALQDDTGDHPCPKPVTLYRRLVEAFSLPHHTVLDPFMGSGTTLVAAKDLGRRAIGIEIEERYCEIAANRCRQEVLGLTA